MSKKTEEVGEANHRFRVELRASLEKQQQETSKATETMKEATKKARATTEARITAVEAEKKEHPQRNAERFQQWLQEAENRPICTVMKKEERN